MNKDLIEFHDDEVIPPEGADLVARIPGNISDKQRLLEVIATELRFPKYFGFNWDALDECLADLSWLEEPGVYLWHDDIPLLSRPADARSYLRVLIGVMNDPGKVKLHVSFPRSAKSRIRRFLHAASHPTRKKSGGP